METKGEKHNNKAHSIGIKRLSKVKNLYKKIKRFIIKNKNIIMRIIFMIIPFILMDVFIGIYGLRINYYSYFIMTPWFFAMMWIFLFIGISLSFKKGIGKFFYILFNVFFMFMFLVDNVYYSTMKTFFDFSLVEAASEGSPYMIDALKNCNPLVYACLLIVFIFFIIGVKKMPKIENNNYRMLGVVIAIFITLHLICPLTYGKANTVLTWSSWRNPRNVYNSFNDNNKGLKITGFYEYTYRNFYITFLKTKSEVSEEELNFLDEAYTYVASTKNKYTSKLKGKNLILIQLEGTDNWLINAKDTPTIYKLMNEGINFSNHYSFYNGGGSTFNSEFAVNTGYVTPISYTQNAYSFNKNSFPNSLANIFKSEGYSVNAFHMNSGEYYSRTVNYKNWGYDNYYGLLEISKYEDDSYKLDRELILNEQFNELLFPTDTKFVDYIIAYSGHTPFTNTKEVCKMLYEEDNEGKEVEFVEMSEEECARRQARETDYMVELLLKNLKEKNLLDNTAIVIFTDHYLYTLKDQTILDHYKNTSNNLINKTPWLIWSKGLSKTKVTKVTSQMNILPTLLNLYGVTYNKNNYIAEDALNTKYNGQVFFNDYSWYDGNVYVENGEVTNGKKIKEDTLNNKNEYINYIIKKNDLTLKYNYFKNKK